AAVALLIGLLCVWRGPGWPAAAGMLLTALAAGWFLSGEPHAAAALRAGWPLALGVTLATLAAVHCLTDRVLAPLRLVLAALTLAVALHVVGVPAEWVQLAVVPGMAALAMLALPPMPGLVGLPVAADIAVI